MNILTSWDSRRVRMQWLGFREKHAFIAQLLLGLDI